MLRRASAPPASWTMTEELESYRLLYRHARNFAVGSWLCDRLGGHPEATHVGEVRTALVPRIRPSAGGLESRDRSPSALSLRVLADAGQSQILAGLRELCAGYGAWIAERARRARAHPCDPAADDRPQTPR